MAANWSALPLDLLAAIIFKLKSLEDVVYFSAVCQSWNCASSSIKHQWRTTTALPWLLLAENTKDNPNCVQKLFNLNNNKCYSSNLPETFGARCWGSPYGWIAVAKGDRTVQLTNPITKANISFPSLDSVSKLHQTDAKYFHDYNVWLLRYFLSRLIVLKVSHAGRNEFVIMMIYGSDQYLAFARHGDQSWTPVLIKKTSIKISDVVTMDDRVFVVDDDGAIAYWNVNEFFNLEAIKAMDYSPGNQEIFKERPRLYIKIVYLIQSGTDLLMVVRYKDHVINEINEAHPDFNYYNYEVVNRTTDFHVYRLNPEEKNWENIENLGDVALVVGHNSSMSTTLAHDKCLQRNCIYFSDDESVFWKSVTEVGGHDMGVYDIKRGKVMRQFYEGVDSSSLFCRSTFFIPQL